MRVWLVIASEPARFNEKHNLWCRTAEVFTTREAATAYLSYSLGEFGPARVVKPNDLQQFEVLECSRGYQWLLCSTEVDPKATIQDIERRMQAENERPR